MNLYDSNGLRKYLNPNERLAFLNATMLLPPQAKTFCNVLVHSGCRISEALALTAGRVDLDDGVVVIESLKKRRRGIFRAVPVPTNFLEELDRVHNIKIAHRRVDRGIGIRLWGWSRPTAWRRVQEVMRAAEISGLHATPKGLRHGFGVNAVVNGIPLNLAQKWLGHTQMSTTSIYANAVGAEERQIAEQMWIRDDLSFSSSNHNRRHPIVFAETDRNENAYRCTYGRVQDG